MDLFGDPSPPPQDDDPVPDPPETAPDEDGTNFVCLGHEEIEQSLLRMWKSGRIHHGLVFSGVKGIGKANMARRLTRFLLKHGAGDAHTNTDQDALFNDPPPPHTTPQSLDIPKEDPVFRQTSSGAHPDMLYIQRAYDATKNAQKNTLDVSEIRKIAPFMHMTASNGGWRIVIIDDADTMNRNAQNALLKILEEPPPRSMLILVTHRLGALIPTIRSRTKAIEFQPLNKETLTQIIRNKTGNPLIDEAVIDFAQGSANRALQFLEEGGTDTLEQILGAFSSYPNWNWTELHILSDYFARRGQDKAYEQFSILLQWIMTQLCKNKVCGALEQEGILKNNALQKLIMHSSLEQLLNICDNLKEHFNKAERANLDKRQAVLSAFSMIAP